MGINFLVTKAEPLGTTLAIHARRYDVPVRLYYYANHNGKFYNRPLLSPSNEVTAPEVIKELKGWMERPA